jgi:hypothetical protein
MCVHGEALTLRRDQRLSVVCAGRICKMQPVTLTDHFHLAAVGELLKDIGTSGLEQTIKYLPLVGSDRNERLCNETMYRVDDF